MIRILHERTTSDLHVTLLWNVRTDRVHVSVRDVRSGDEFIVVPDPDAALDAFYHPFCFTSAAEVEGAPELDLRQAA